MKNTAQEREFFVFLITEFQGMRQLIIDYHGEVDEVRRDTISREIGESYEDVRNLTFDWFIE